MVFAATASRVALGSTRTAALRRSAQLTPVVAGSRIASRANSTSSSHHGEHKKTSDLPWAISSALFFGSAFIYLTSPASKTHNEHGHVTGAKQPKNHGTGTATTDDRTGDDAVWKKAEGEEHEAAIPTDTRYEDSAQPGDMHLAQHASSKDAPEQKSPSTKDRDPSNETSGVGNSNFQSGVKHSKDGEHVSDPKRVVAAANATKQDKKAGQEELEDNAKDANKNEAEGNVADADE